MSVLLFGAGFIAFVGGLAMVGFGIPVSEFSFGNTLIIAGATTAIGGLIVFALGAVVLRLQSLADLLGTVPLQPRSYGKAGEPRVAPAASPPPIPFPTRPKTTAEKREPASFAPAPVQRDFGKTDLAEEHMVLTSAPVLPNPDEPPLTVAEEEVSLSPPYGAPAAGFDFTGHEEKEVPFRPLEEREPSKSFDEMWPAKRSARASDEAKPQPTLDQPREAEAEPEFAQTEELPPPEAVPELVERREVAVLKSGVVDGMAYTLYVDGSIEAELPQGTLHFASIDELRKHLEGNG